MVPLSWKTYKTFLRENGSIFASLYQRIRASYQEFCGWVVSCPLPRRNPEVHRVIQVAGAVHQHQRADCVRWSRPPAHGGSNPWSTAEERATQSSINSSHRGKEMEKVQGSYQRKSPPSGRGWRMQSGSLGNGTSQANPPRRRSLQRWAIYETEQEMASGIDVLLRWDWPIPLQQALQRLRPALQTKLSGCGGVLFPSISKSIGISVQNG